MSTLNVFLERGRLDAAVAAVRADVRLLASVNADVALEVAGVCKAAATVLAAVRLVARVRVLMSLQLFLSGELLWAVLTHELALLVEVRQLNVGVQADAAIVSLAANVAQEGLDACVSVVVLLQVSVRRESPARYTRIDMIELNQIFFLQISETAATLFFR